MSQCDLLDKAFLKLECKIFGIKAEILEWKAKQPYFALTQEMIDGVVSLKEQELEVWNFIKDKL